MEKTIRRSMSAAVVALLAFAATSLDGDARQWIGAIVGAASLLLIVISRVQLGKSFSVKPKASTLVTTGLYSKIEHPLYCFLDLFLAALIIVLGMPMLLVVWGILVAVHLIECRREEKILGAAFADEYQTYRSQTWL